MTEVTDQGLVLTDEFHEALDRLHAGENLFLTGKAGTGKSTLIRRFMATTHRNVVVVAPTGIAALNVGGYTIHRLFSLRPGVTPEDVRSGRYYPGRFASTLRELHTLIVDEASMVRADLFDALAAALELHGPRPGRPFGGVQVVLVGDLYQLPPVVSGDERDYFATRYPTPYFFSADAFHAESFPTLELTTVFRQIGDTRLVDILNAVREGVLLEDARAELNTRTDREFEPPIDEFWLTLTTTNRMATARNRAMLAQLPGPVVRHAAVFTGDLDGFETPVEREIEFARGAQVMMLVNDPADRWVNGTIARVADHYRDEDGELTVVLDLPDGSQGRVTPELWEVTRPVVEGGSLRHEVIGTYTQLPFRLAWAVTIHKSQGQTLSRVVVDLTGGTFADGQLYVALSRCTSFDGLVLRRDVIPKDLKVDQRIRRFLRASSAAVQGAHRGHVYLGICSVGDEGDRWRPRPVELAAVTDDGIELHTLVNPTRDLGDARTAYGITAGDVQLAPLLEDAWAALAPHLAGRTPVGVGVDRELGYLDYELKRNGYVTSMPLGFDVAAAPLTREQRLTLGTGSALERARAVRDLAVTHGLQREMGDVFPAAHQREGYLMPRPAAGEAVEYEFLVRCSAVAEGSSGTHDAVPHPGDPDAATSAVVVGKLREAVQRGRLSRRSRAVVCAVEELTGQQIVLDGDESSRIEEALTPGTRVCFTGTVLDERGLEISRWEMEDIAAAHGLRPVPNVTKTRCDALVCAEDGSQSNKTKNAAKWGKPVFTAAEFFAWTRQGGGDSGSSAAASSADGAATGSVEEPRSAADVAVEQHGDAGDQVDDQHVRVRIRQITALPTPSAPTGSASRVPSRPVAQAGAEPDPF